MSALVSLPFFFFPPWLPCLVVERLPKPENTSALGWPPLEEEEVLEGDVGPRLMAERGRNRRDGLRYVYVYRYIRTYVRM